MPGTHRPFSVRDDCTSGGVGFRQRVDSRCCSWAAISSGRGWGAILPYRTVASTISWQSHTATLVRGSSAFECGRE